MRNISRNFLPSKRSNIDSKTLITLPTPLPQSTKIMRMNLQSIARTRGVAIVNPGRPVDGLLDETNDIRLCDRFNWGPRDPSG
jgi:hypothetical protein